MYIFGTNVNVTYEPRREKTFLLPYANNKGADQHTRPRILIGAFVVCCLDSIIPLVSISKINFKPLPSFCGRAGRFESYLVAVLVTKLIWSSTSKEYMSLIIAIIFSSFANEQLNLK